MLPEVYIAPAVAREIVQERERRIVRRQLLSALPVVPSRSLTFRRRLASSMGSRLVSFGERMRRYGQQERMTDPWLLHQ